MVQWEVSAEHESNARLQARYMSSYAHAEGLPRLNSQFPADKPRYEPLPFVYHCVYWTSMYDLRVLLVSKDT